GALDPEQRACERRSLDEMIGGEEPLHLVRFPVGDDDADARVRSRAALEPREDAEEMRQEDPVHAAVADDEDRPAGVLAGELVDRGERSREDLVEGFAARPRDEAVLLPLGETGDLVERLSGPVTDIDLA